MLQKRVNLFGVRVDDISMKEAILLARNSLISGKQRRFFTPNLEMLSGARKDGEIRDILNSSSVNLSDGTGIKIIAYLLGTPLKNTCAGIDFGERLIREASKRGLRVFLLGGIGDVAEKAGRELAKKHHGLRICGVHHGYFSPYEEEAVCNKINVSRADIVIVCRGFPRQEIFVCRNADKLPSVKVFACLGGSLDVWSGEVKRAPALIQEAHFEWLWRILLEPCRAKRFVASLDALFEAFGIWVENLVIFKNEIPASRI